MRKQELENVSYDLYNNFGITAIGTEEGAYGKVVGLLLNANTSEVSSSGAPMFDYYNQNKSFYSDGIGNDLCDWAEEMGFSFEWIDPSTVSLVFNEN